MATQPHYQTDFLSLFFYKVTNVNLFKDIPQMFSTDWCSFHSFRPKTKILHCLENLVCILEISLKKKKIQILTVMSLIQLLVITHRPCSEQALISFCTEGSVHLLTLQFSREECHQCLQLVLSQTQLSIRWVSTISFCTVIKKVVGRK